MGLNYQIISDMTAAVKIAPERSSIIAHNLGVISTAKYVIDLGPEGGDAGGHVVATGTPEEIMKVKSSYTGKYLKQHVRDSNGARG